MPGAQLPALAEIQYCAMQSCLVQAASACVVISAVTLPFPSSTIMRAKHQILVINARKRNTKFGAAAPALIRHQAKLGTGACCLRKNVVPTDKHTEKHSGFIG